MEEKKPAMLFLADIAGVEKIKALLMPCPGSAGLA
jgi:hypothetical protein